MKKVMISSNKKVLFGKWVVDGTRIPISLVMELYKKGWTNKQIVSEYPSLERKIKSYVNERDS